MPSYPAIPYTPVLGSWSKTPFREPLRTDMDGGNQRARRRAGDNVPTVTQSVQMSGADYATFESFLIDDLANGTLAFTMLVWSGTAFVSQTVKFTETPVPTSSNRDLYVVPMKLDIIA